MNSRPFSDKEFKAIYSKVPRVSLSIVVEKQGGIVLSLRSLSSYNNQWHFPGSTILYKETVKHAINRVAIEELGIKVKFIKLLGWLEYPSEEKERGFGWPIDLVVLCKYKSGKFKLNGEATQIKVFKKLPKNTIKEQARFLKQNKTISVS
jgi:ADP-ribose pyrophosphatase YjhB (NUDIX family)